MIACGDSACTQLQQDHQALMLAQTNLDTTSPKDAPVVMAVSIHEELIGQMLTEAVGKEIPPIEKKLSASKASIDATLTIPSFQTSLSDKCDDCIQLGGAVSVRASAKALGAKLFSTRVRGRLTGRVPLKLIATSKGSALKVDLKRARIEKIRLDLDGLPSWARKAVQDFASDGANSIIKKLFKKDITLARWEPIPLPGSPVKLTASKLNTFPKDKELQIGFATNIAQRQGSKHNLPSLKPTPLLKSSKQRLGVTFSGLGMTALTNAAIAAGTIPVRLNDDFKPDPNGDYHVTFSSITPTDQRLRTNFTVWHLPKSGSCFAADVQGMVSLKVNPNQKRSRTRILADIKDLEVQRTRGDDTLLRIGLWVQSTFMDEALEASTRLLTADTLQVGPLGKKRLLIGKISFDDNRVTVTGDLTDAPKASANPRKRR